MLTEALTSDAACTNNQPTKTQKRAAVVSAKLYVDAAVVSARLYVDAAVGSARLCVDIKETALR